RLVMRLAGLAEPKLHFALHRLESPGQPSGDIGVETYRDHAIDNTVGSLFGALRRAAIARDLAKELVERDRGIGHADHAKDERAARQGDGAVRAFLSCPFLSHLSVRLRRCAGAAFRANWCLSRSCPRGNTFRVPCRNQGSGPSNSVRSNMIRSRRDD